MAENLNYAVEGSKCYNNLESNCNTYGRLYDWATAMGLPSSCNSSNCSNQVETKHRGICPAGWHIPSSLEWTLASSWGFPISWARLPGGYGRSSGSFGGVGNSGYWWSASEVTSDSTRRYMYYSGASVVGGNDVKSNLYSVRCLQD